MFRALTLAIAMMFATVTGFAGTEKGAPRLRIPLGFDVFYDWPGATGGGVSTTRSSVIKASILPSSSDRETVYIRAVALGKTTIRSRSAKGPSVDVEVVKASESEFAEFVTQELGAQRIVEPLPIVVGDPPSVVHDDVVSAVIVSDDTRLRVVKKPSGKGQTAVLVAAAAPGWVTLTIFDKKKEIARRFAFHLRPKAVSANASAPIANAAPLSTATAIPPTATAAPPPPAVDPEATVLLTIPHSLGVVIPFASSIPAAVADPKSALEHRRLLLPAGRQALYLIARDIGNSVLRVSDSKGVLRHEFRVRVVPSDSAALNKRCDDERRQGSPCEAVLLRAGELKIVDIAAPVGTVVSSDANLLRYARRSGSEMNREISLQALAPGVTDLNLFDDQGILRRRMIIRIDPAPGAMRAPMVPIEAPSLPVPK